MHKLLLIGLVAGACSNRSTPSGSSSGTAGAPGTKPGVGACGSLPLADFQALIKDPITKLDGNPIGACNVYVDQNKFLFAAVMQDGPDWDRLWHPEAGPAVAGVGDAAYYTNSESANGPNLHAKKGRTYCMIDSPETSHTTITSASPSDRAIYVKLMAKLCSDMFAAQ